MHYTIHGRIQGLQELASWAFGPGGLPELQILACGDPSRFDRWDRPNELYCRNEDFEPGSNIPYRVLRSDDFALHDLFKCHKDMLTA